MRRQKRSKPLPNETSAQLRARLRRFALATREEAMQPVTVPFPEHVSVLAGPLRIRKRKNESPDDSGQAPTCDPKSDVNR